MAPQPLLIIDNLHVTADSKMILRGLSMTLYPGEIHAIIGPNGSGKSTLGYVLAGHPHYQVVEGSITFQGKNLLKMTIAERASQGIFLAFQQPIAIPGVQNMVFMKTAVDAVRKQKGMTPMHAKEWLQLVKQEAAAVGLPFSMLARSVNDGFSGGEKKRNELLQMRLLNPLLAILDETDSGLDAHALQALTKTVSDRHQQKKTFLVITHYLGLLEAIHPNVVHIIQEGKLAKQGDLSLARQVLKEGYGAIRQAVASSSQ
ncbi:MAG: Fe-S cluster assembly ATPase SufC [Bacteroidota bacterium]